MNVKIIAVGKLKKSYIKEGVDDFVKRLSKYAKINLVEVKDEKDDTENQQSILRDREGKRILSNINEKSFVCALDINGKHMSSTQFAGLIKEKKISSTKELVFVIGGSTGLSNSVLERADCAVSFSKMTFPHGLMRVILLEQLYRAEKILAGEPYHK